MRVFTAIAMCVVLVGCGGNPKPNPLPVPAPVADIDVVAMLFSTPCDNGGRDIGGGTLVCDSIGASEITRKTVTPGYQWNGQVVETWSVYLLDSGAGCIGNGREETRLQSTKGLVAVQDAEDHLCWGPVVISAANAFKPFRWPATISKYTWYHFDGNCTVFDASAMSGPPPNACTVANLLGAPAHGSYLDWTEISGVNQTLTESYVDTTGIDAAPLPYCVEGRYGGPGLISLSKGSC